LLLFADYRHHGVSHNLSRDWAKKQQEATRSNKKQQEATRSMLMLGELGRGGGKLGRCPGGTGGSRLHYLVFNMQLRTL